MSEPSTVIGNATAHFISLAAQRDFAPEIVQMAKMCLVDSIGVALGALYEPAAKAVRQTALSWNIGGNAHMLYGPTAAPAVAALVNGTMGHCMDYDDTHMDGAGHLSTPTWAATLAMAEAMGRSELEALTAFITGFEVAARLGAGGFGRRLQFIGFHPSSIFGRFAAAAATSVLLGLDEGQVANALGVAATTASGLNASFGTMSKPFHLGKAAMDGILAAQLAAEGFEAATHLLDADNGLSGALVQSREVRIDPGEYSDGFALLRNSFKPYACCKATHAFVDAARSLADTVQGQRIERIVLGASPMAKRVAAKPNPSTPLEAKFSVAYCVALGLNGYRAMEDDFSEERVADPVLRALLPKVELDVQPDMHLNTGFMDVVLADGRTLRAETPWALGNPDNPMGWNDMQTKFHALVAPILGDDWLKLFETLRGFDQPGSLAQVIALTRPRDESC
jgi:2-methylcitrate dehydratase PrpD